MSENNAVSSLETSSEDKKDQSLGTKASLGLGLLAGLTASACCAGPLILLMLGVSGSWIGNLSALEPYRPIFIIMAVGFLGLAFYRINRKAACDTQTACATPQGKSVHKALFWITVVLVLLSIAFPWYGPILFD